MADFNTTTDNNVDLEVNLKSIKYMSNEWNKKGYFIKKNHKMNKINTWSTLFRYLKTE